MSAVPRMLLQFLVMTAIFAAITIVAAWPRYRFIPSDSAVIKLSFAHGASREGECRRLTADELARLPVNMRRPIECPRGRRPIFVELDLDGKSIYAASLLPSGLSGDGPSRVYQRFVVPAGAHQISVRMRDTARTDGFDHARTAAIALQPAQNFVIDFQPQAGGFVFR